MSARSFTPHTRQIFAGGALLGAVLVVAACAGGSSNSDEPALGDGSQGGGTGTAGSAGSNAGTAGTAGKAGTTAGGGTGGTAGKGGAGATGGGGAGGATGGAGGSTGGTGGSGGSTGGSSGSKGGSGGSTGGTGGSTGGSSGSTTGGAGGTSGGSGGTSGGSAGTGGSTGGTGGATGGSGGGSAGSGGAQCGTKELCNGIDDTCDGKIDEGNPESGADCDVPGKLGECKKGTMNCVGGVLKCISTGYTPKAEICNGLDDDCDGTADNGTFDPTIKPTPGDSCDTGKKGICKPGTQKCQAGVISCVQDNQPLAVESCNGQDDNCDGQVDEGSPGAGGDCVVEAYKFTAPGSPCGQGKMGCCSAIGPGCPAIGQLGCIQQNFPKAEICNGVDDDCNGAIDGPDTQNLPCNTGLNGVCSVGNETCAGGVKTCTAVTQPNTSIETCDNKDNDCDGQTDEAGSEASCAGKPHVAAFKCQAGGCLIATCDSGYIDLNGNAGDGCECSAPAVGASCGQATSLAVGNLGTVSATGVVTTGGGEAWFSFTFPSSVAGQGYKPKVQLVDPTGKYIMDVFDACGASAACGNPGDSPNDANLWEQSYSANVSLGGDGACGVGGRVGCTDAVSRKTTPKFRVRRKDPNAAVGCDVFTLTATHAQ